jgi:hypothetical protein
VLCCVHKVITIDAARGTVWESTLDKMFSLKQGEPMFAIKKQWKKEQIIQPNSLFGFEGGSFT